MHRTLVVLTILSAVTGFAQRDLWEAPFPAHTIAGNLHSIGTADLSCFLITTPEGHILINTGLASSFEPMRESARKLGYKLEDVKILLTSQAHFDHTEALAAVQKLSGAKMYATEADAPYLRDGGKSDPSFNYGNRFEPVKVDRILKDGEKIRLGGTELTVILTPGHSKGSVSYAMTVNDKGTQRKVLMVNMASVVLPLVNNKHYPNIVEDFEHTFRVQKAQNPDIWLATHGSQYNLNAKYKAGSFVDPKGYHEAVARHERMFRERLAKERAAAQ